MAAGTLLTVRRTASVTAPRITQETFLELEKKALLAVSEPLCLDPSINVTLVSNGPCSARAIGTHADRPVAGC